MKMKKSQNGAEYDYRDKSLRDTLILLTIHPNFQKSVERIRSKLDLPLEGVLMREGVSGALEACARSWLAERDEVFLAGDYFQNKRRDLESEYETGLITQEELDVAIKELSDEIPSKYLRKNILDIIKKYNLSNSFYPSVEGYVVHNTLSYPSNHSIFTEWDAFGDRSVCIQIHGYLTRNEMDSAMRTAVSLSKDSYSKSWGKFPIYSNLERDLEILRLSEDKSKAGSGIQNDFDIVARVFEDADDLSKKKDIQRSFTVRQARRRIKRALRARFPRDTFDD